MQTLIDIAKSIGSAEFLQANYDSQPGKIIPANVGRTGEVTLSQVKSTQPNSPTTLLPEKLIDLLSFCSWKKLFITLCVFCSAIQAGRQAGQPQLLGSQRISYHLDSISWLWLFASIWRAKTMLRQQEEQQQVASLPPTTN